jgi:hypothetical protein
MEHKRAEQARVIQKKEIDQRERMEAVNEMDHGNGIQIKHKRDIILMFEILLENMQMLFKKELRDLKCLIMQ